MENNMEKKMEQEEKRVDLKEEVLLDMVKGGAVIIQDDGTLYCTICRKKVGKGHLCSPHIIVTKTDI